ncbi:MAG: hypothetical protein FWC76_05480 [Defluviitaleaceae bacterium]|nr:hypothetical protein [Defluviitaleaceae bacterium]
MARKPRANSHDKTIRNLIIGFGVVIAILAAVLIWNNRDLGHAGTVDGVRMPFPQLQFHHNEAWNMLTTQFFMMEDQDTLEWAFHIGFESLVDLYVITGRAAEFDLSRANVDAEAVNARIESYREMYNDDEEGFDIATSFGFTNTSFRQFVELRELHDLVYQHVTSLAVISEDALAEAYEQNLEDNFLFNTDVLVHIIEVATQEDAEYVLGRLGTGEDFIDLMRAFSITYDPNQQIVLEDGTIVEARNVRFTSLEQDDDLILMAYDMAEGEISGVLDLPLGGFAIIEIVEVNELIEDFEVHEANFRERQEIQWRDEYFREWVATWREEANIVRNTRVVGEGFE